MFSISGYKKLKKIYETSKKIMYTGYAEIVEKPIILKVIKTANTMSLDILKLQNEYESINPLNIQGISKPYKLEKSINGLAYFIEGNDGILLSELIRSNNRNLRLILQIFIKLTKIISLFHKSNIIHKGLTPTSIMYFKNTGNVNIIDFTNARKIEQESKTVYSYNFMEENFAYNSPEQTGRMNRELDYRTDFYSLGVILYELITGQLPFETKDRLEMVHSHLVKKPVSPVEKYPEIPLTLSNIIMKLLAKNAEDRYQSAYGLQRDLEKCLEQWTEKGYIENFILGQDDISEKFQISGKIYGREQEINILLDIFEKVANGHKEMMLISGDSGIGKTRLVNEINKPIVKKKGYFISGKCDELNRQIPYYSIIQAFQSLINQLLTESEDRINFWKEEMLKALGVNGQVIVNVIPEVELIIGKQPPIQTLSPNETMNRFIRVFISFINIFTKEEHPLVIFIDDLQWADKATLKLIEIIMTDVEIKHLFIIGGYQDKEKGYIQPLRTLLEKVKQEGLNIETIELNPLTSSNLKHLIVDTLHCSEDVAKPLSEIIYSKTYGNPIFVNEFLKALYEQNVLKYDFNIRSWYWKNEEIDSFKSSDNVIDLMTGKIKKLNEKTKNVLKIAACIGTEFSLENLAIIYEKSKSETFKDLLEAVEHGIIIVKSDFNPFILGKCQEEIREINSNQFDVQLMFLHERIQQAVSILIPKDAKKGIHFIIGKLILECTKVEDIQDKVFEIINHLNLAKDIINNKALRIKLAQLNLIAAKKAKSSSAYELALEYSKVGISLLSILSWKTSYELTFDLFLERAEGEFLNINYDKAEELFETIFQNARTILDKIKVYKLKMILYTNLGKIHESVNLGIEALKLLDINISLKPNILKIALEVIKAKAFVGRRKIEDLALLSELDEPQKMAIMDILMALTPIAYLVNQNFFVAVVMKIVNISLKYGNSNVSAFGYGVYGLLLGSGFGKYKEGYDFGKLGLTLKDKFQNSEINSKCSFNFGWFLNHWYRHAKENVTYLKLGVQEGLDAGDLVYAAFCSASLIVVMNSKGDNLDELNEEATNYYNLVKYIKNEYTGQPIKLIQQMYLNLQGLTQSHLSLSDHSFDECEFEKEIKEESIKALYYIIKMQIAYLFGNNSEALLEQSKAKRYLPGAMGTIYTTDYYFYYSLVLTALYPTASPLDKKRYWKILKKNQQKMKKWADNCPDNFSHKYLLISAEMAAVKGDYEIAVDFYNNAINSAKQHGYNHIVAIGHELAGKRFLDRNIEFLAYVHMVSAKNAYIKWGASEKARYLQNKYKHLLIKYNKNTINSGIFVEDSIACTKDKTLCTEEYPNNSSFNLDQNTIFKASQTISGEIVLDQLLKKLMIIVLENAGAQKGYLILEKNGELCIEAEGVVDGDLSTVLQSIPIKNSANLSKSIIHYVVRTKLPLVLDDAINEGLFTNDSYIIENHPKSILSIPILHQGKLIGLLYLENNLYTGAFTPERVEVLRLLSTQFAISIDNARLYTELEKSRDKLTEAFAKLEMYNLNLEEKVKERTSDLEKTNKQLRVSEESYKSIFENTGTAMLIIDKEYTISLANSEAEQIFGYSKKDLKGKSWLEFVVKEDLDKLLSFYTKQKADYDNAPKHFEYRAINKEGKIKDILLSLSTISGTEKSVLSLLDISERKRAEELIKFIANHDALTGLPNRKVFREKLQKNLSEVQINNRLIAVMFLDIDNFKLVNDTFGHEVGDFILCEVAKKLKSVLRENDMVCRMGGDEFTIVLYDIKDKKDVSFIAEKIINVFKVPTMVNGHEFFIEMSIGISIYNKDGSEADKLIKKADDAMYVAKRLGKYNYQFYDEDLC